MDGGDPLDLSCCACLQFVSRVSARMQGWGPHEKEVFLGSAPHQMKMQRMGGMICGNDPTKALPVFICF